ncbi:MAG: hypothetical protein FWF52_06295 [Candidatus Azobacteroides sp.]|nr:hypothetical protein [Candidatus Azobacteroides sp.]
MRHFILIMYLLLSFSCASQKKEIISKSTIKLEGKSTNIENLIEINGYYAKSGCKECATIAGIMFFDDGIWVDFRFKKDVDEEEIKTNMFGNVISGIGYNNTVRWGIKWGIYQIINDTIIVSSFNYGDLMGGFWIEYKYKVENRENIQLVYMKSLLKKDEKYNETQNPWLNPVFNYQFISADSLLPSDCWIKEKKWAWPMNKIGKSICKR